MKRNADWRIYKYPLEIADEQAVELPIGARLLSVGMQGPNLCLWAMVDTTAPVRRRHFAVVGTGHPMPDPPGEFVGTVFDRVFVWHVFAG